MILAKVSGMIYAKRSEGSLTEEVSFDKPSKFFS